MPLTIASVLAVLAYLRGWFRLNIARKTDLTVRRLVSFVFGVLLIWIAAGSPLSVLDEESLTVHMIQHLLLMTAAPGLILLGAPVMPILHGLPSWFVRTILGRLFRNLQLQGINRVFERLPVCWVVATAALILWHIPSMFALGQKSETCHMVEHGSFLIGGFIFWRPVIQPWPSHRASLEWSVLLYLFLATLPCDILSGFLVFSERVVYPAYLGTPHHFGMSVLEDQECAGALMWTWVTILYLLPAAILTTRLLGRQTERADGYVQS